MTEPPEELVCVGVVAKIRGVLGEVEVQPSGESAFGLASELTVFLERGEGERRRAYRVMELRPLGRRLGVKFEGVDTPEDAQRLVGEEVMVDAAWLPKLPEGQYYHYQIVGLEVVDGEGNALGRIREVLETGGNDVYVVGRENREVLIPATDEVIVEVDLAAGRMTVNVLPGLIDQ